jgi:hypothetical protein
VHIFHPDLTPLTSPSRAYSAAADVSSYRVTSDGAVAQELFRRSDESFGFRYRAWVNFADAGGGAHHTWHEFPPSPSLVTDSVSTARQEAEAHSEQSGLQFESWITPKA